MTDTALQNVKNVRKVLQKPLELLELEKHNIFVYNGLKVSFISFSSYKNHSCIEFDKTLVWE